MGFVIPYQSNAVNISHQANAGLNTADSLVFPETINLSQVFLILDRQAINYTAISYHKYLHTTRAALVSKGIKVQTVLNPVYN
jgi:hypothetical protein